MATQAKTQSLEGGTPPTISAEQLAKLRHLAHVLQPSSALTLDQQWVNSQRCVTALHAILDDIEEGLSPAQMRQARLEGVLA